MTSLFHRATTAAGALCLCMACGMSNAAAQARVVSSTWLPGGKYALVCAFEGAEYMTITADPPGACVAAAAPPEAAQQPAPPSAPVVSRAEAFPTSSSYVGGFFIDPLSAALRATGLGLLLGGSWPSGLHGLDR
ncbi:MULTISPECIES: hypothetical protein [unclassified Variovorax]|uniref:hypothetical protein n=1 Tax=unclassified Variovorax TaxID=663243 RepID=UPI003F477117